MEKQLEVCNLEFQWPGESMVIGPYTFVPVEDYRERFLALQHLVSGSGGRNGKVEACTGSHQITGVVHCPDEENPAALGWGHDAPTELDDILLLLSMCTRRKVFVLDSEETEEPVIIADHRMFHYGGGLRLSLGQVKRTDESGHEKYSIDLEDGLTKVNHLIRSSTWRSTYGQGGFLHLFAAACHRQALETSFVTCWTIWEHLYSLLNATKNKTKNKTKIRRISARKKIVYILKHYGVKQSVPAAHEEKLKELVGIRNTLVHHGQFSSGESQEVADIFIRLTEIILASVLGLDPSNVFSAEERFDRFLNNQHLI